MNTEVQTTGPGLLSTAVNTTIDSGSPLELFTARQNQNTLLGLFNGFPYIAGTLFVDSATEQWCIYYPDGNLGTPFTVYYKNCLQQATLPATILIDKVLTELHPYNEFPGWIEQFTFGTEDYYFRRRHLDLLNLPKDWTLWISEWD